jgi:hypothetical protein
MDRPRILCSQNIDLRESESKLIFLGIRATVIILSFLPLYCILPILRSNDRIFSLLPFISFCLYFNTLVCLCTLLFRSYAHWKNSRNISLFTFILFFCSAALFSLYFFFVVVFIFRRVKQKRREGKRDFCELNEE